MANLTDIGYFVGDITLPTGQFSVNDLNLFIDKFEPEVLTKLLGYTLYKKLIASPTDPDIVKLVSGSEYTIEYNGNERLVKWAGLKNDLKISLIAYYVYVEFMRSRVTHTQSIGETKSIQENSTNANIFAKVMSARTRFDDLYGYMNQSTLAPSAYNFLKEHEDNYPEWEFSNEQGSINSHDL